MNRLIWGHNIETPEIDSFPKYCKESHGDLFCHVSVGPLSNARPYFPDPAFQTPDPGTDPFAFISNFSAIWRCLLIQNAYAEPKRTKNESLSSLCLTFVERNTIFEQHNRPCDFM